MAMADTDGDGMISLVEFAQLGTVLQDVAALKKSLGVTAAGRSPTQQLSVSLSAQGYQVCRRLCDASGLHDFGVSCDRCHVRCVGSVGGKC